MMGRILRVVAMLAFVCLGLALAAGWWGWQKYQEIVETPFAHLMTESSFVIDKGASLHRIANQLEFNGIVAHPLAFRLAAKQEKVETALKAGEYQVSPSDSIKTLLAKFVAGETVQYSITLIEGRTVKEALEKIISHPKLGGGITLDEAIAYLGELAGDSANVEGAIYPDTYVFDGATSARELIRIAQSRLQSVLAEEWSGRVEGLPLSNEYEALILASIIEKETAVEAERPQISGVFIRRLGKRNEIANRSDCDLRVG